jgi:hypothetical protein
LNRLATVATFYRRIHLDYTLTAQAQGAVIIGDYRCRSTFVSGNKAIVFKHKSENDRLATQRAVNRLRIYKVIRVVILVEPG